MSAYTEWNPEQIFECVWNNRENIWEKWGKLVTFVNFGVFLKGQRTYKQLSGTKASEVEIKWIYD